ncbi:hypothetical protein L1987_51381 [Smallanthus sonchifolius]|uniref:Uncharacterized protein n=1 Tax=Smallanthus sonchifolius TaxID=185202 RepID=A0ACB9ERA6_9ASTR|nr:hypothetical protein L1987_51381 [Smallanthus sonchifolius]
MDFGITTSLSHDEKNSGSKQERSDDHHHFLQHSKSSRTDCFDQPNKTMPMRSDSMLSLSAADANNMLSFSSSSSSTNATKDANKNSLFSFYQTSPAYIRNTDVVTSKAMVMVIALVMVMTDYRWECICLFQDGWGAFHLGFSGNTDPEPGRCRRTDGKKWRCSRDAVPDHKYCERHINRGRHRSRKPVEGQNGHAVTDATASKVGPVVSSSSVPGSTTRATATALSGATLHHRNPAIAASTQTPISRTQESADSLMYPTNYTSFLDHGASNPNPLPHFVDPWSKDVLLKQYWTQLTMSIPMASSDFSSSSNSPAQEKLAVPPLGPTPELHFDPTHKQASTWIPILCGNSMGGPLGEVLNRKIKNPSSGSEMNQMTEMWDAVNCHMGSSPTGVLQKTTFVSLSNSSQSSSPKGNKTDQHV